MTGSFQLRKMYFSLISFIILSAQYTLSKNVSSTDYCKVKQTTQSKLYPAKSEESYDFDFSVLSNAKHDQIINFGDDTYLRIQFCNSLLKSCNDKMNYAVCLHKNNGEQVGIGKEPPVVKDFFGRLKFEYVGDKCNNSTRNYTVNIEMKCNYLMINRTAADIDLMHDENQCDYNLILETEAACVKEKEICTAHDESAHYNLNSLTDYTDNYEVPINESLTAIFNVCHFLAPNGHVGNCGSGSAACLINRTDESNISYKSLGKLDEKSNVQIGNGVLTIEYMNGDVCDKKNKNSSKLMRTTLIFICDPDAKAVYPRYIGGSDNCNYRFAWPSRTACSEESLQVTSVIPGSFCTVKDPLTEYEYDLTELRNKPLIHHTPNRNEIFQLRVCGAMSNCPQNSGVCSIVKGNGTTVITSGGMANSNLLWRKEGPYLNYTDGSLCPSNRKHKFTIISFVCGEKYDFLRVDKACSTYVTVFTKLVCREPCATEDGRFNFAALTNHQKNYLIENIVEKNITNEAYEINVCRPLHGSSLKIGICKISSNDEGHLSGPTNLGYPTSYARTLDHRTAVMTYKFGDTCKEDPSRKIFSRIIFKCDIAIPDGTPKLIDYNDCIYTFEWKTVHSCGQVEGRFVEGCMLINILKDGRNFTILSGNTFHYGQNRFSDGEGKLISYNMTLCGNKDYCDGSYVCDEKVNYGTQVTTRFDYKKNLIQLHFTKGSKCEDGSQRHARLTIKCVDNENWEYPRLISKQPCSLELEWATRMKSICQPRLYNPLDHRLVDLNKEKGTVFLWILSAFLIFVTLMAIYVYRYTIHNFLFNLITT